jgi:uncharacterized coiled-coil protein SlyX
MSITREDIERLQTKIVEQEQIIAQLNREIAIYEAENRMHPFRYSTRMVERVKEN